MGQIASSPHVAGSHGFSPAGDRLLPSIRTAIWPRARVEVSAKVLHAAVVTYSVMGAMESMDAVFLSLAHLAERVLVDGDRLCVGYNLVDAWWRFEDVVGDPQRRCHHAPCRGDFDTTISVPVGSTNMKKNSKSRNMLGTLAQCAHKSQSGSLPRLVSSPHRPGRAAHQAFGRASAGRGMRTSLRVQKIDLEVSVAERLIIV